MQEPLLTRKADEWWAEMEEVFHIDGADLRTPRFLLKSG